MYKFKTVLEEVVGDRLDDGRVYLGNNLKSVHPEVLERAKRLSVKTILSEKVLSNKMQIHFSFKDNTAMALDF